MKKTLFLTVFLSYFSFLFAQNNIDSLLKLTKTETNQEKLVLHFIELSATYLNSDIDSSLQYGYEALHLAKQSDNEHNLRKAYHNIGTCLLIQGRYENALNNYFKAYELSLKGNNTQELLKIKNNIGVIYDRMRNYEKALEYYLEVQVDLNNSDDDNFKTRMFASLYNNLGNAYDALDDNSKALEYYRKGVEICKQMNDEVSLAKYYRNMGDVNRENGEYEIAYNYLKQSLDLRLKLGQNTEIARSYLILGEYFQFADKNSDALESFLNAFEYAKKANTWDLMSYSSYGLFTAYEMEGNYKASLDYLKLHKAYNDSSYNQRSKNEFMKFEIEHKFQEKEIKLIAEQEKTRFKHLMVIFILIATILFVLFLFAIARNRANKISLQKKNLELEKTNLKLENDNLQLEKTNLKQDLVIKNKELTTNVIYLVEKNEIIRNISEKLLKAKKSMKPENKEIIRGVLWELQQTLDNDIWDEFEMRFQQVHNDFYAQLQEKHPDLTPNDKKLCALLRLNMTTKDIAAITKLSQGSIEVARSRLRKKLNISNTDINLVNFLMEV